MYRLSPFTYLVSGLLATGLARSTVHCAENEFVKFQPPQGSTCGAYMSDYIKGAGGYIVQPQATENCSFCAVESTDVFLAQLSSNYDDVWRNFGILWVYVIFNVFAALALYWLIRMPKNKKEKADDKETVASKGAVQGQMLDEHSRTASPVDNEKSVNNTMSTTAERQPSTSVPGVTTEKM
jgi:ATP-binding cassette subfamily G (WHITE) protein 2 (PDR)